MKAPFGLLSSLSIYINSIPSPCTISLHPLRPSPSIQLSCIYTSTQSLRSSLISGFFFVRLHNLEKVPAQPIAIKLLHHSSTVQIIFVNPGWVANSFHCIRYWLCIWPYLVFRPDRTSIILLTSNYSASRSPSQLSSGSSASSKKSNRIDSPHRHSAWS